MKWKKKNNRIFWTISFIELFETMSEKLRKNGQPKERGEIMERKMKRSFKTQNQTNSRCLNVLSLDRSIFNERFCRLVYVMEIKKLKLVMATLYLSINYQILKRATTENGIFKSLTSSSNIFRIHLIS